jgi:diguanylate cyclase
VISDAEKPGEIFQQLGKKGIKIILDSFGAGLSSLAVLKNLPISKLKIDPSYMQGSPEPNSALSVFPEDTSLVAALTAMARALNLDVVAEAIQTQAQLDALKTLGCDEYQGPLSSKPLPASELLQHLHLAQVA